MMYGHGLATIALSEAYGLTGDAQVGRAAQGAVNFILNAQNRQDGGWRYNPGDPGDTCVLGWQLTALKSAHMAGLNVGGAAFSNAGKFLDSVSIRGGTEYGYQPAAASSPTMTAVGLLGRQYLGAKRRRSHAHRRQEVLDESPARREPVQHLLLVLWHAGHAQHERERVGTWDRKIRNILVRTQVRNADQCANGSWDPAKDVWGRQGGRVMTTSLAVLTLETYYRFLPIFKSEFASASVLGTSDHESGK